MFLKSSHSLTDFIWVIKDLNVMLFKLDAKAENRKETISNLNGAATNADQDLNKACLQA